MDFEQRRLWSRTLADQNDVYDEKRRRLRHAFLQFRSVVEPMANEISNSMPMFTDHSISHCDALWDTASLLTGSEFEINPAEAFVLGGAFLLHDLGMGLVAYPGGAEEVKKDPLYLDMLALAIEHGEYLDPARQSRSKEDLEDEILVLALRARHAEQAERLIGQTYRTISGDEFKLLEDTQLRQTFGPLIGRISCSHWWDVSRLQQEFPRIIGAAPFLAPGWRVDPLKVACILRLADASQIDSRRAPTYLSAFRTITGVSREHWKFQQMLQLPIRLHGRLEYSASRAFTSDESEAWWLAFDTLRMIDRELSQVDALCADSGRPRFTARSVAGADSPNRMMSYLPTDNWVPIDASLRVTHVDELVRNFGGNALYGNRPEVALRELIANAGDATRVRLARHGGTSTPIVVQLSESNGFYWLTVSDQGIGMDAQALVSSLTDFGHSAWKSTDMVYAYPGLMSQGYRVTGKYGVGFYSVFMIADHVEVRSLKYEESPAKTHVLQFPQGLRSRPLLRSARQGEFLHHGGTVVRARLLHHPLSEGGCLSSAAWYKGGVGEICRELLTSMCALSDIEIQVQGPEDADPAKIVGGDDWKTLPAQDLFRRVYRSWYRELGNNPLALKSLETYFVNHESELRDPNGEIIGRATFAPALAGADYLGPRPDARIYVGGLYADEMLNSLGVFVGRPLKADRFSAFPVAEPTEMTKWARRQVAHVQALDSDSKASRHKIASLARAIGEPAPGLPCGFISSGEICPSDLASWIAQRDEILIVPLVEVSIFTRKGGRAIFLDDGMGRELIIPDSTILCDPLNRPFYPEEVTAPVRDDSFANWVGLPSDWTVVRRWYWLSSSRSGDLSVVIRMASSAWSCGVDEILDSAVVKGVKDPVTVQCVNDEGSVSLHGIQISRPRS